MNVTRAEISSRLTLEIGLLAGRFADFLSTSLPLGDGPIGEGRQFLQTFFDSVTGGRPPTSWSRNPFDRGDPDVHPLDRLARSLNLSVAEIELLLAAAMCEEHEGFASILRSLHPRNEPYFTVGLAAQMLGDGQPNRHAFRRLIESGTVVRSGAIEIPDEGPFYERSLRLAKALWSALHGIDVWPAGVDRLSGHVSTAGLEEWLQTPEARRAIRAIQLEAACTIMMTAENDEVGFGRGVALVSEANVASAGILLPATFDSGLEKSIQIHTLLRGVVPIFRVAASDRPATSQTPRFTTFPGPVVACSQSASAWADDDRRLLAVPVERPLPPGRRRMWSAAIPSMAHKASLLASHYPVEPSMAAAVAADLAFVTQIEGREAKFGDVATIIRARGNVSSSAGATLIRPHATWDDLVLPPDRLEQLREAVSRLELQSRVFDEWGFLRNRTGARGVRLLFTGPPGTGKTLSAEVLANALNVDLLIVDLSRVVSKWIGETEKNLGTVFDAAERGQAALFFDEADALFGKRTEVSDAHDRYANLETAYLLTRLERFEGLAVLATNLRENIDSAFLRRLEFVIDFEEPDREERFALWNCHLPKEVPLAEDVNLYELAALYPIVGGVIRNAAVAAGFLAAADNAPIDRRHFIHAIQREYAKAGRSFPGAPIGLAI